MGHRLHTVLRQSVLAVALSVTWLLGCATLSAQDSSSGEGAADGSGVVRERPVDGELLDCRAVDCFQRATCNRRVLGALTRIKTTASEVPANQSPDVTHRHITAQIERQERLRTFVAPECRPPSSVCGLLAPSLASACRAVGRFLADAAARAKPPASPAWPLPASAKIDLDVQEQRDWLSGQWEGWLFYDDNRAVPLWLRLARLPALPLRAGHIKACSDHGMVLGLLKGGVLELPRRESLAFGSRIRLWRGAPHHDDLEGVVLLEVEPGREIQTGLVWLSRVLTPAPVWDLVLPTDYPCQDKELLDTRKKTWDPNQ